MDSVSTLLELRTAQLSGCSMVDVSATRFVCGINSVKVTISFITYPGQVFGVNVATLGVKTVASVVQDPLEAQYSLVLTKMTATMAFGELPSPLGGEHAPPVGGHPAPAAQQADTPRPAFHCARRPGRQRH